MILVPVFQHMGTLSDSPVLVQAAHQTAALFPHCALPVTLIAALQVVWSYWCS